MHMKVVAVPKKTVPVYAIITVCMLVPRQSLNLYHIGQDASDVNLVHMIFHKLKTQTELY